MNEENKKYLPIGTVVMLKNGKKRVMITGFCSSDIENKERIYDYNGCLYPEGYLSPNQVFLFDHEQIDKIYYLGYSDEEEMSFKIRLDAAMEQYNKGQVSEQPVTNMQENNTQQQVMQQEPIMINEEATATSNDFLK